MISIKKKITSTHIDNILHVDSLYSVFLFVLINGTLENTLFICSDAIPESFVRKVPNYVQIYGCNKEGVIYRFFSKLIYKCPKYWQVATELAPYRNCTLYGHDHIFFSGFFHNKKISLIEDGLSNYRLRDSMKHIVKNWLGIEAFGRASRVEKIYLTGRKRIPYYLSEKVIFIDLIRCGTFGKYLGDLFGVNLNIDLSCVYDILLTQPLSEDGILDENDKVNIYQKIVDDLLKECSKGGLIIKTHPREKTNYQSMFSSYKNVIVLSEPFPVEIIGLSVSLNKVVTIFSTGATTLKDMQPKVDVIFLGTKIHPKISQVFGDLEL